MTESNFNSTDRNAPARLLILKTGTLADRMPGLVQQFGDCDDMFIEEAACPDNYVSVVSVYADEIIPEPPTRYSGVLITGSAAMVSSPTPWMTRTASWLRLAVDARVPVLGVCFGHQLLAYALGGTVGENPAGPEAGSISVRFNDLGSKDPLFSEMPSEATFNAHHYETVLTLPPGATILAENALDRHQAVRFGPSAWGIQFHPEISAAAMSELMKTIGPKLDENGVSSSAISAMIEETPAGPDLLKRYLSLVLNDT